MTANGTETSGMDKKQRGGRLENDGHVSSRLNENGKNRTDGSEPNKKNDSGVRGKSAPKKRHGRAGKRNENGKNRTDGSEPNKKNDSGVRGKSAPKKRHGRAGKRWSCETAGGGHQR